MTLTPREQDLVRSRRGISYTVAEVRPDGTARVSAIYGFGQKIVRLDGLALIERRMSDADHRELYPHHYENGDDTMAQGDRAYREYELNKPGDGHVKIKVMSDEGESRWVTLTPAEWASTRFHLIQMAEQ